MEGNAWQDEGFYGIQPCCGASKDSLIIFSLKCMSLRALLAVWANGSWSVPRDVYRLTFQRGPVGCLPIVELSGYDLMSFAVYV